MHLHFLPDNFIFNSSHLVQFHHNRNKIKAKYFLKEHKRSPEIPFTAIVTRIPELIRVHQTRILMIKSLHLKRVEMTKEDFCVVHTQRQRSHSSYRS